jgi:hypothetical protein
MNAPIIKINNVVEYYMENAKTEWGDKDFPNTAPPFEKFILEFTLPEYVVINGKRYNHPLKYSKWKSEYETFFLKEGMTYDGAVIPEDGWILSAYITSTVNISFMAKMFCNKFGVLTPIFNVLGKKISTKFGLKDEPISRDQGYLDLLTSILQPQLLALSFMHCKNVTKEEVDPNKGLPRRVIRHWEKKGKPLLDKHYVLNIEPMKNVLKKEGDSAKVGIQQALHICRGHFKNYTEGKGLFGKYHGLFWWEDHVKGNQESGEVNKVYNVKI